MEQIIERLSAKAEVEIVPTWEAALLRVEILERVAPAKLSLLIVLRTLLRITQRLIGLVYLFETCCRIRIVLVEIWMMLLGQTAICRFDLILAGALGDA